MTILQLYSIFRRHPQITTDSRNCPEGSIFFALKGENFNGNKFAAAALDNGCSYAVVDEREALPVSPPEGDDERFILVDDVLSTLQQLAHMHRKQFRGPVIQITGTNGKTTTKELVSAVLSQKYNVLYTQGNLNNHIGVPLTLLRLTDDHDIAVIETGANHPGEIKALAGIVAPDYGLITNVGIAHIEGFGSFEGVVRTKGELYDYLRDKDENPESTKIFLNADNPHLARIAEGLAAFTYGGCGHGYDVEGGVVECAPFLKLRWYNRQTPSSLRATPPDSGGEYGSLPNGKLRATPPNLGGECGSQCNEKPGSPSKLEGVAGTCAGRGSLLAYDSNNQEVMHMRTKNLPFLNEFRRELRNNGTSAEAALWNIIKNRQIGNLKFRRQYSINNYILDFYCPELQLAIELDGDYHNQSVVDNHDFERDRELEEKYNIKTLRYGNRIVFEQPEVIVQSILEEKCNVHRCARQTPSSLRATPPNLGGEYGSLPNGKFRAASPDLGGECGSQCNEKPGSPSKLEGVAGTCAGRGSLPEVANEVQTHLIGSYNIDNVLAAVSVGLYFGVEPKDIDKALADYVPTNNRSEMRRTDRNMLIVDAYNANPSSMKAALDNFSIVAAPEGMKKMLILGDMRELGEVSEREHKAVVDKLQEQGFDNVWLVGGNFRSLNPPYTTFADVGEVKAKLKDSPIEGYLILIKGSNGTRLYELPECL